MKTNLLLLHGIIDIQGLEDIAIYVKIIGQSLNFTITFQRTGLSRFTSLWQFRTLSYFPPLTLQLENQNHNSNQLN